MWQRNWHPQEGALFLHEGTERGSTAASRHLPVSADRPPAAGRGAAGWSRSFSGNTPRPGGEGPESGSVRTYQGEMHQGVVAEPGEHPAVRRPPAAAQAQAQRAAREQQRGAQQQRAAGRRPQLPARAHAAGGRGPCKGEPAEKRRGGAAGPGRGCSAPAGG